MSTFSKQEVESSRKRKRNVKFPSSEKEEKKEKKEKTEKKEEKKEEETEEKIEATKEEKCLILEIFKGQKCMTSGWNITPKVIWSNSIELDAHLGKLTSDTVPFSYESETHFPPANGLSEKDNQNLSEAEMFSSTISQAMEKEDGNDADFIKWNSSFSRHIIPLSNAQEKAIRLERDIKVEFSERAFWLYGCLEEILGCPLLIKEVRYFFSCYLFNRMLLIEGIISRVKSPSSPYKLSSTKSKNRTILNFKVWMFSSLQRILERLGVQE